MSDYESRMNDAMYETEAQEKLEEHYSDIVENLNSFPRSTWERKKQGCEIIYDKYKFSIGE